MKAVCKLSRMFEQDKEQFQRPNKEVDAEVFQNRSVSEWKQSGKSERSEAEWQRNFFFSPSYTRLTVNTSLVFK